MSGFDADRFRSVAGSFPSGVTVVTGIDEDGPAGFTCQSFHALSLEPPMVVFAVAITSTSWPRIRRSGLCCVNVLAEDHEGIARAFATTGIDKFASQPWRPAPDGSPILDGVVAWFDCEIDAIHPGGDHEVVMARVTALDDPGGTPLLFHQGRYVGVEGIARSAEHR